MEADTKMTPEENIYRIMSDGHMNQASVARAVGITPQVLNGMLKGRRPLRVKYIDPLCKALKCEPNEIFGYKKENHQITVTAKNGEVVAVITNDSVVEYAGYHVILS